MPKKVWIWTVVLAFLGYALEAKGAIESPMRELIGTCLGAALGFFIGWMLHRYDKRRLPR